MQIPEERIVSAKIIEAEPKSKTVEVQTDYRESGSQTVPFSHDSFTIDTNNVPEVLAIVHFTYGNGLPASMAEMELIE